MSETETPPPPPPPTNRPQPPSPKRQKMSSSTNTSDDDVERNPQTNLPKKPRYKRRKVAIFFAYCGVGYQGMQKNPGAKTIEGDLEEALYFAGAVPEAERGQPRRFDWARSARTDKGVSAVGQVVSGKFYVDPPGFIERLNENLPAQIRIFGYKRTTASFNAKKFCDKRRYVYLIPVFALDPSCHRDRESVMASVGSGNELVKCVECSERGRKVFGVMGKRGENTEISSGISSTTLVGSLEENGKIHNQDVLESGNEENGDVLSMPAKESEKVEFLYSEEVKSRFNRILKYYEGTHNFHNFTTRTKAEDPSAKRYIISFNANTTLTVDGIEFVKCEVVGQSFMLHQIRKMIGLAVAIMRNLAPESLIEKAFEQKTNVNVPMAPEVGLYLDECFFSSYNKKWNDTHEELSMKAYAEEAEEFKMKYIYTHIASTEHKDGVVALWLHSLNYRNFPDLLNASNSDVNGNNNICMEDKVVTGSDANGCGVNDQTHADINISSSDANGGNGVVVDCAKKEVETMDE